jgi:hypothetical protein
MKKQTAQLVFPINVIRFKSCEILKKICTEKYDKESNASETNSISDSRNLTQLRNVVNLNDIL